MSPRTLDASTLAAMESPAATVAHLYEFYRRRSVVTGQQLVRIVDGLVDDVETSGLSDLSAFTVVTGTWALSGGKIECTDSDPDALLRYDGISDMQGLIWQVLADPRSAGDPYWGAASLIDTGGSPDTNQVWLVEKKVATLGGAPGVGIENQDTLLYQNTGPGTGDVDYSQHVNHPVAIGHNSSRTGGMEGYAYKSSNGPLGFGFLSGSADTTTSGGSPGLWVRGGGDYDYTGTIYFTRASGYRDWSIRVIGLVPGYSGEIETGASPAYGADVGGNQATAQNPTSTIDPWGDMYPFTTIKVWDGVPGASTLVASAVPSDGLWGGDVWELQATSLTSDVPEFEITDASGDIEWNGKTFEAIGGEVAWDGYVEADDRRAQGMTIEFSNVDQSKLYDRLIDGQHVGLRCRVWRVHFDEPTGTRVGDPVLLTDGEIHEGLKVTEQAGVA